MDVAEKPQQLVVPSGHADRLGHIDALRAIAALLVVWMHVSQKFFSISPATLDSRWVYDWSLFLNTGRIGVVLFFAISGFVIPFSIRFDSTAPVREFLLRRFFRIFPAYWLSIPLGILTGTLIWGGDFPLRYVLVNLTLLQYWLDIPSAMGLYWTLVLEVVFYLCCAVLIFARSMENYQRIATLATVLVAIHIAAVVSVRMGNLGGAFLASLWFFQLGIMFWGTLFRAWYDGRLQSVFPLTCAWIILAFIAVIYPAYFLLVLKFESYYYLPYALAIGIFVLGTTAMKIRFSPLVWIGRISYSIYLLHPVVFNSMLWLVMKTNPNSFWRTRHVATYVIVNTAITIVLASFAYRWVEKPAIEMGRALSLRWFGTRMRVLSQAT